MRASSSVQFRVPGVIGLFRMVISISVSISISRSRSIFATDRKIEYSGLGTIRYLNYKSVIYINELKC